MKFSSRLRAAFTLVELIVVMAVIIVLVGLSAPVIGSMQRSKDATTAAFEILDAIEQARTYAIANNTYVFLGFTEVDGTKSIATVPQVNVPASSVGRVAIAVVATKDGTLGVSNPGDIATSWPTDYMTNKGLNFAVVRKLQVFDNMHIATSIGQPPATGPMARPDVTAAQRIGNIQGAPNASSSYFKTYNTFSWPLGSTYGQGQFNFERVLTFNPQGTPYAYGQSYPTVKTWFELGLQQSRGNAMPTPPPNPSTGNQVAIIINGTTGTARIYRP